jgi:hypothetical protein
LKTAKTYFFLVIRGHAPAKNEQAGAAGFDAG